MLFGCDMLAVLEMFRPLIAGPGFTQQFGSVRKQDDMNVKHPTQVCYCDLSNKSHSSHFPHKSHI